MQVLEEDELLDNNNNNNNFQNVSFQVLSSSSTQINRRINKAEFLTISSKDKLTFQP